MKKEVFQINMYVPNDLDSIINANVCSTKSVIYIFIFTLPAFSCAPVVRRVVH